jgi:hypothetical protein
LEEKEGIPESIGEAWGEKEEVRKVLAMEDLLRTAFAPNAGL